MKHIVIAALAVALTPVVAHAQPALANDPTVERLRQATDALDAQDYARASQLARPVLANAGEVDAIDRAEAYRIHGIASFFLTKLAASEEAFLAYLRLDPEAHIDPGRYPPELVVFFEDIRARHRGELLGLRARPQSTSEWSKNLFPPWGQFANGHHTKAWTIAITGFVLGSAHLGSYLVLRSACNRDNGVCWDEGSSQSVYRRAQVLRTVNFVSGAAAIGVYLYGVIDGFYYHRRLGRTEAQPTMSWGVTALPNGAVGTFSVAF